MNLEKLKQLALIDQMGGQPQAEQQQQESKNRTAIALMQSLMQQEGESARLNAQQENIRGDQAYRTQSLANQTGERTAANEARATSAKAEAERLKVAKEQAAAAEWYAQDRYTTDAAQRAENLRLQADQTKTAAANEAAKVTATALNNKRARAVDIYKLNLAAGMDPRTAATGLDDPELQAAGIAAQEAAVRREAAKYIAQVSSYPKTIRNQILNEAMKGGMHPDTRAMIDTHFNSQPTAPTAPNVSSKQLTGPTTGQTQEDFDQRNLALKALGMLREYPKQSRRFDQLNAVSRPWQSDAYAGSPMYDNQQAKFDAAQKAKAEMLAPFLMQLMGTKPINLNEA